MFIPFKNKKNAGEFVSVFSRSQYGFGWESWTFGAFKSWDDLNDLIFRWIPRYSTRETPHETTWSCDTTPLILTKSCKSSKSSKSWSFSSLCFCACCRRLDLGPQITITFRLCFVSDGVPTPPVGWELRDQQPSEVMRTQNNNGPKECERKNRCVNVHVLLCETMSDKKSVNTVLTCSSVCTFWTMGYWLWGSKKDDRYCIDESILIDLSNCTMGNFWLQPGEQTFFQDQIYGLQKRFQGPRGCLLLRCLKSNSLVMLLPMLAMPKMGGKELDLATKSTNNPSLHQYFPP